MDEVKINEPTALLESLGDSINQIHQCKSINHLLSKVREIVERHFGLKSVWIYSFEKNNPSYVKLITFSGQHEDFIKQEFAEIDSENDEMFREILQSQKPVYVENALTDWRTNKDVVAKCGARTILNCQLAVEGKPIGTLGTGTFFDEGTKKLNQNELAFFEAIAKAVGIAFDCIVKTEESFSDVLTGLCNRRGLRANAEQLIALAERNNQKLGVLYIDLKEFKPINDKYGHEAGDAALVNFSNLLRESFRKTDVIARVGGDEFVVLAIDIKGADYLDVLVTNLKERIAVSAINSKNLPLDFNYGVAIFPKDSERLDELISVADKRMYTHKSNSSVLN